MLGKLALPAIRELIEAGDDDTLHEVVNRWHSPDLAELVAELSSDEQVHVLHLLKPARAAETFEYLDLTTQEEVLKTLTPAESACILNEMAADDRTALLAELPQEQAERLIGLLEPGQQAVARALLDYGEDSVGRLMTPDYVVVRKDWTIRHVLDHVRAHGRDSETLNVIYVVDDLNKLIDDLRIREILLSPLHAHVADLMDHKCVSLSVTDDKKTAVEVFRKYDRTALPVVDTHGRLAGIVTLDDVIDIAEEEATRSIQKFGGQEALDEPYMSTALPAMVRKRATWLVILFVGEMFTATAMGFFQDEIARAIVLALFVPLIISSGGNSGSQAATLIIRALALGEVTLHDWWKVLRREILAGLLLGSILASIGFVRIAVWNAFMPGGCELRLMSSVNDVNDIPKVDRKVFIVAAVENVLHFRMFDGDGELVVDTDETRLTTHARQIEDLKKQLVGLWPPHELTRSEKTRVISALTSIVGQALPSLYGRHWFLVALTVSISLVGVVVWGTLTGSMLPFLLRRLGFDPATSSAPFVATLVDVTGLIIYFSVAMVILHNTLL